MLNLEYFDMSKKVFDRMIAEIRDYADYNGYKGSLEDLFLYQNYEQQTIFMEEYGLDTYAKRKKFRKYLENF